LMERVRGVCGNVCVCALASVWMPARQEKVFVVVSRSSLVVQSPCRS
jgi:hypothetical protein